MLRSWKSRPLKTCTALVATSLLALAAPRLGTAEEGEFSRAHLDFFENEVRPILSQRCLSCHGDQKQSGGLRLDRRDAILAGGDSGPAADLEQPLTSLIWEAVNFDSFEMPPEEPLPEAEIQTLKQWLELGLPWPDNEQLSLARTNKSITDEDRDYWAFRPLSHPDLPMVRDPEWCRNGIDHFVLSALERQNKLPAPPASNQAMLRRLAFDLTGLPPTRDQLDRWQQSPNDTTWESLVDEMLDSPGFGERWGQYWLDLVRYADSDGYKADDFRPQAYRYRDYVIRSFNQDKPFDQFTIEQLAGDLLPEPDADSLIATGYLRNWIYEYNQRDVRSQWTYILDDITEVTGDVFLGLGLGCARCHDHKYDPLLQTDYYQLQACFAGILPVENLIATSPKSRQEYQQQSQAWEQATAEVRAEILKLEAPHRQQAEDSAVEKFPPDIREMFDKPAEERNSLERQLVDMAWRQAKLEVEKLDMTKKLTGESLEQWQALQDKLKSFDDIRPKAPPQAWGVRELTSHTQVTLPDTDTPIRPGIPQVLVPDQQPFLLQESEPRRLALARWLVSQQNPITARVMVNRIWLRLTGEGLAPNPNDFGQLGGTPENNALLDYLAARWLDNHWHWKPLIREIVTSSTYRLSSDRLADPHTQTSLADGRFTRRRLDAGQIRDALLMVSGDLSDSKQGPPRNLEDPSRTIYLKVLRNQRQPLLDVFDFPDRIRSAGDRNQTTTPQQALLLINGPWTLERAQHLAERVRSEAQGVDAAALEQLYRLALARSPAEDEAESCQTFLDNQQSRLVNEGLAESDARDAAWVDLCHAILNCNEFLFLD